MKYWWIRIFDYKTDEELKEYTDIDVWEARRGTLLTSIIFAEKI